MKTLIVAHPDDEILWFNPEDYDRIVIVFLERDDNAKITEKRKEVINTHPLKEKITWLGFKESKYHKDKTKLEDYNKNYNDLCEFLKTLKADEVYTHNAMGEYQHSDHILVYRACMNTLNCRVNNKDPKLYRKIKEAYGKAWTWY